jgi:hypothetical protein
VLRWALMMSHTAENEERKKVKKDFVSLTSIPDSPIGQTK